MAGEGEGRREKGEGRRKMEEVRVSRPVPPSSPA